MSEAAGVKALLFDTYGTVVDWRGSVLAELEALGAERGLAADWARILDDWKACYGPGVARVTPGPGCARGDSGPTA